MPSTASATVAQGNLIGNQLIWTDTGSYSTIVSRILTIYDANGNVLSTVNLGATLTLDYAITADGFYQFVAIIIDNTGTFTSTIDYVATGFYTAAYLNAFTGSNCGCSGGNLCNMDIAENFYNAALRMNLASNFVASQNLIIAANIYINLQQ